MAHRALLACRRPDGRFTLLAARGGDRLAAALGLDASPDALPAAVSALLDPSPLAVGVEPADVLALLDPSHETLVVLAPDGTVTPFLVCPLELDGIGDPVLAETTPADAPALRRWWVGAKSHASAAAARGELDPATARAALLTALSRRARAVHSPDDAAFLTAD